MRRSLLTVVALSLMIICMANAGEPTTNEELLNLKNILKESSFIYSNVFVYVGKPDSTPVETTESSLVTRKKPSITTEASTSTETATSTEPATTTESITSTETSASTEAETSTETSASTEAETSTEASPSTEAETSTEPATTTESITSTEASPSTEAETSTEPANKDSTQNTVIVRSITEIPGLYFP